MLIEKLKSINQGNDVETERIQFGKYKLLLHCNIKHGCCPQQMNLYAVFRITTDNRLSSICHPKAWFFFKRKTIRLRSQFMENFNENPQQVYV